MSFFSSPSQPSTPAAPPPPPPPPALNDSAAQAEAVKTKDRARKRTGYASTILTSGLGVQTPGPNTAKTLLGE